MVFTEISSSSDFNRLYEESKSQLLVVHFWASWSKQCVHMNEVLSTIAAEEKFQNVAFTKVEAETYPEISQKFNIAAVPTFIFIKNTTEVDRLDGADAPELSKKVEKHANSTITLPSQPAAPVQDLNTRLKTLINSAPCMVFMKGVPDQPRCGFSKTLMQILRDNSIKFSSFNILEDEEVRQGLKKFSDWPTYPQVYVNGELIGGLDIIKEMAESGSLLESMPKQESLNDRLKSLINQSDVVLFMKGDPETPRCGFSKQTIAILDETG
ncbi:unnamed protein product, partial [Owenia fusiformis]